MRKYFESFKFHNYFSKPKVTKHLRSAIIITFFFIDIQSLASYETNEHGH
jgi:hypothetical protein